MFCSFHIQNAAHIAQKRIIPQRPLIKTIADLFEVPRPYVRLADRYRVLLQLCPIGLSKKDPFCPSASSTTASTVFSSITLNFSSISANSRFSSSWRRLLIFCRQLPSCARTSFKKPVLSSGVISIRFMKYRCKTSCSMCSALFGRSMESSFRRKLHISASDSVPCRLTRPAACKRESSDDTSRNPVRNEKSTPASTHEVATSVQSVSV